MASRTMKKTIPMYNDGSDVGGVFSAAKRLVSGQKRNVAMANERQKQLAAVSISSSLLMKALSNERK